VKHLKFINEYNSDSLYYQVNMTMYSISSEDDIVFSQSTYDLLSNKYDYLNISKRGRNAIVLFTDRARIDIWETSDEYFYAQIFVGSGRPTNSGGELDKKMYKCDTLQGLYQLIDDYLNRYEYYMQYGIKENNSFSDNGYYRKINSDEFYQVIDDNFRNSYYVDMHKENVDKLSAILKHQRGFEVVTYDNKKYIRFYSQKGSVYILETDDYYFKVATDDSKNTNTYEYYLCDQIDGVIKLLKDSIL
jgi:hypothetical protein